MEIMRKKIRDDKEQEIFKIEVEAGRRKIDNKNQNNNHKFYTTLTQYSTFSPDDTNTRSKREKLQHAFKQQIFKTIKTEKSFSRSALNAGSIYKFSFRFMNHIHESDIVTVTHRA